MNQQLRSHQTNGQALVDFEWMHLSDPERAALGIPEYHSGVKVDSITNLKLDRPLRTGDLIMIQKISYIKKIGCTILRVEATEWGVSTEFDQRRDQYAAGVAEKYKKIQAELQNHNWASHQDEVNLRFYCELTGREWIPIHKAFGTLARSARLDDHYAQVNSEVKQHDWDAYTFAENRQYYDELWNRYFE